MKKFNHIAAVTSMIFSLSSMSHARETSPYSESALLNDQAGGKTVVLDFHADWCSTCKAQKSALESVLDKENFKGVTAYTVNFDKEEQLKNKFHIHKQSTLVVLKGDKEMARRTGVTDQADIQKLITLGI